MEANLAPQARNFALNSAAQSAHLLLQEALNATDRVHSVSSYTVAPCGQLQVACGQVAPEPEPEMYGEAMFGAEMLNTEILPFVDGVITSSNSSINPAFAFSASTDPGVLKVASLCPVQVLFPFSSVLYALHCWLHPCVTGQDMCQGMPQVTEASLVTKLE